MRDPDAPCDQRDFPGNGELGPLLPPRTTESAAFFDALKESRFVLQRCSACGRARAHVGPVCPYCGGETSSWQTASGAGSVHSWVRYHRPYLAEFDPLVPYVVLCIALDEGPRVFGRLVDADKGRAVDPLAGMRVEMIFERWPDGGVMHAFTQAERAGT